MSDRLRRAARWLEPPAPYVLNPREPGPPELGRWNLYIGGAGRRVPGSVNLDILLTPGVDVVADAHALPFPDEVFQHVECDAVLEHVRSAETVMEEMVRVTRAGGTIHAVTPFCHPYHEFPRDFRRFTIDGLRALGAGLEEMDAGWRTGPTATLLVTLLEWTKMLLPWRWWRVAAHGVLGWVLSPLRYADLWLLKSPRAPRIGNHCYIWWRKPIEARKEGTVV